MFTEQIQTDTSVLFKQTLITQRQTILPIYKQADTTDTTLIPLQCTERLISSES